MIRFVAALLLLTFVTAATSPGPSAAARTAAYLEAIRADSNPTRLTAFLADIPKGGDLHHHLTAVYAESYIHTPLRTVTVSM